MDISDVDGETIERAGLKDKAFESFVKRLLRAERSLRHRPDADVQGPVAEYRGDDKRDLVFVVHGQPEIPRTRFTAALTWDELGTTWYSCKGGGSWKSAILQELGQTAYKKFEDKGQAPGPRVKKRPPKRLLDHIQGGGRYVFVISSCAIDDRDLLDETAAQLRFWLGHEEREVPTGLRDQLAFIDANRLADFISTHKPELSEEQRRALQIEEPRGLEAWSHWTDSLAAGRDLPEFEADAEREALFTAIADPELRVLRIFGPPGVGKTRVVHEGIRRCGAEAQERTRYCGDVDLSLRIVQDDWLRRGAKPWLVLDELRSDDVDQISAKFSASAGEGARLFLVGTSDAQARAIPGRSFLLSELGEAQTRRLIAKEASGLPAEQREAIWQLSEGYPWYAVLLARAIADDEQVLEYGGDDATRWHFGTQRVLAGNPREYGGDRSKWTREAELRAKALLVAMLTRDIALEWDELCERHGPSLRMAIAEPSAWDEVVKRERVCRQRQLLRQSGLRATRRYVSPNNLARLILHHFLTDPDLGPKIRRHTPQLRSTLVAVAKAVRVKPALIERLARGEWEELERRARDEGLDSVEAYVRFGDPCYEAAHDAPEAAATTMAKVVVDASGDELARAGNLRAVATHVFEHVIHRKISPEAFLAVEAALVHLARVDDSPFSNNPEGIWKSLFLPGLDQTHQGWSRRRARLEQRLADADAFVRGLAVSALAWGVHPSESGLGHGELDKLDGDWPLPTRAELLARKTQLWALLLDRCKDADAELSARAQSAVANEIRGAVGRGLDIDDLVAMKRQVHAWHPGQRRELLESIADLRRYGLEDYAKRPDLIEALDEIERAAAPVDLSERVRGQIGSWHPGPWQLDDPDRAAHERAADLELARALLDDTSALAWALDWSTGPEAHRAAALWFALGYVDQGGDLLDQLAAARRDGFPALGLGQYLLGWGEAGAVEEVEAWLTSTPVAKEPTLMESGQWFLVFQAPTQARLDHLRALISGGVVVARALVVLGARGWATQVEFEAALEFLALISEGEGLAEVSLRFADALLERELSAAQRAAVLELVCSALRRSLEQRVVIGIQRLVVKLGRALAEVGKIAFLSALIIDALTRDGDEGRNIHVVHELLAKLLEDGHGEALWPFLAGSLVGSEGGALLRRLFELRLLGHVSAATVLDWVGTDRQRALAVASLASPHSKELGPIVCELLVRFGADSEIGGRLRARALSLPGTIAGGFVQFLRRQRDNARAWQQGALPAIASWARAIERQLDEELEEVEAQSEIRAKYG